MVELDLELEYSNLVERITYLEQENKRLSKALNKREYGGNNITKEIPTFDRWFEDKHGISFDEAYRIQGSCHDDYIQALSMAIRDYAFECELSSRFKSLEELRLALGLE
jgi:hypothetical protein